MFKETVARWGDRVAMRKKEFGLWHDISWNDYDRNVGCVGLALMSMGLEKGDCASIIGDNCPEWVYADMGIQCCGGARGRLRHQCLAAGGIRHHQFGFQVFLCRKRRAARQMAQFPGQGPQLEKVIVWDTEGLRHFKDPMVMTFDDLLELGAKEERGKSRQRWNNGSRRSSPKICPC